MTRNKKLKRTARGDWYWRPSNNIAFRNGLFVVPNTPVNKPTIDFLRCNPMNADFDFQEWLKMPDGYKCPSCGNEISLKESQYGEATLCSRCPSGEYTQMEPYYLEF